MLIPHNDPNPEDEITSPVPVDFPKEESLTWIDFHPEPEGSKLALLPQDDGTPGSHWKRAANDINDFRTQFARHNPIGVNPRCSNLDRSAVLALYQEALVKLEHASDIDSLKIRLEVMKKVSTILDLRAAEPDDSVFYMKGAFLSPLEPHYAQPRLDYYNRGVENEDDSYYWAGLRRLKEWRKEGWPRLYPTKAVERERREREERKQRQRMKRALMRDTASEGLLLAYEADPLDWGEEVEADPDRPWR